MKIPTPAIRAALKLTACLTLGVCLGGRVWAQSQPTSSTTSVAARHEITSPDGALRVEVRAGESLTYSVRRGNTRLIDPSLIKVTLADSSVLGPGSRVIEASSKRIVEAENLIVKGNDVRGVSNELHLEMTTGAVPARRFELFVRVYDNCVGLRYRLPEQTGLTELALRDEEIGFNFTHDASAVGTSLSKIAAGATKDFPLIITEYERGISMTLLGGGQDWPPLALTGANLQGRKLYESPALSRADSPLLVEADIEGTELLHLVTERVAGKGRPAANWAEAEVRDVEGRPVPLGRMTRLADRQTSGPVMRNDLNIAGGPLRIGGASYELGIGTAADSDIAYSLNGYHMEFRARIGLDETADEDSRVRFALYASTRRPAAAPRLRTIFTSPQNGRNPIAIKPPLVSPWLVLLINGSLR